jgi:glycosyltransferase involved in cell wall biosynthesis
MTGQIRLLIVSKSTGGVATYVRSLANGLNRKKFSITVACLSENGEELAAELVQKYGVQAFSLAMNRYKVNPLTDAWVFIQLAHHIRREKYDVIHAHASKPGFLMRIAAIGTGIPVIYSPHNFAFHEGSKRFSAWLVAALERFAMYFTAKIVAVAQHERDLALKYGVGTKDNYVVIHTGIDARPFRNDFNIAELKKAINIPVDAPVIGAVGRLAVPKLPMDFVKVAAGLCKDRPDVHFVWIGSGPLEADAKRLSSTLGLDDNIHWLGQRSDTPALYNILDCFVLLSRWEAYPYVILEAFASGVPVIATRNLGAQELIETEVNGRIVPQGDIQAMVDSIKDLLENPDKAKLFRLSAKKQVDELYTMQNMLLSLEEIYIQSVPGVSPDGFISGTQSY